MKVLIPGIAGHPRTECSRMRLVERRRTTVAGYRSPALAGRPPTPIVVHHVDLRKRAAEEVFRQLRPDAVVHMATVSHFAARSEERYRININGTRIVFDHCVKYGAKHCVFVGRHTYYGAAADSPLYHSEDGATHGTGELPRAGGSGERRSLRGLGAMALSGAVHHGHAHVLHARADRGHGTLATFLQADLTCSDDPRLRSALSVHARARRGLVSIVAALDAADRRACSMWQGPSRCRSVCSSARSGRQRGAVARVHLLNAGLGRFGLPKLPQRERSTTSSTAS